MISWDASLFRNSGAGILVIGTASERTLWVIFSGNYGVSVLPAQRSG